MIMSDEMEKSVYQEPFQFFIKGDPILLCLSLCPMKIDDNVTEGQAIV